MKKDKAYRVKVLDFRYENAFSQINFRYLFYNVLAQDKENAIKIARDNYMRGEEGVFSIELPLLLKLFSVEDD